MLFHILGEKLAEDHADEIQRLADKTDLNEVPVTVEEVASKLFPEQGMYTCTSSCFCLN